MNNSLPLVSEYGTLHGCLSPQLDGQRVAVLGSLSTQEKVSRFRLEVCSREWLWVETAMHGRTFVRRERVRGI